MKIHCKELNRDFDSKAEMIAALVKNKDMIIAAKKANPYEAHKKGQGVDLCFYSSKEVSKGFAMKDDHIYPVISNTGYMDAHLDVHLNGSMNKTAQQQQGNVYYIINHQLEVGKVIAQPSDVKMMIKEVSWKELGKDYTGNTQALIFETKVFDYSNDDARKAISNKLPVQNSIRMQYLKLEMGVKERREEWKEENAAWDKYIDQVVNSDVANEAGYVWFVSELKIMNEGSMVLFGSNDATEILYPDTPADKAKKIIFELNVEEVKEISNLCQNLIEPESSTQLGKQKQKSFYDLINKRDEEIPGLRS